MKKFLPLLLLVTLVVVSLFRFIATENSGSQPHDKKFKTPSEIQDETVARKIKLRAKKEENRETKPDQPSAFVDYYNKIRTKSGDKKPGYSANYKLEELAKAKRNNQYLKSKQVSLDWKERGPGNVSGRTRGLIIDADDPSGNSWIAGSVGGGIWKTNDAGKSWTNITPDLPTLATVCLAQSASDAQIIYAGTGEGFYNNDAIIGDGIFKSTDKGKSWNQLESTAGNSDFFYVNRIIVDPNDHNKLLAATNTSIQKSNDGGLSWLNVHDDFYRIQQIISQPGNFNIQYATANTSGILKSTDGGNNWKYVMEENSGRIELAIAPSETNIIYALTESSQLYISTNSGDNWVPCNITSGTNELFLSTQGWYNNALAVSPDDPDLLIIGGVNVYKVAVTGQSTTASSFITVKTENTESFMNFINHGGGYLNGGMEVNLNKKNYSTIEVQFGPGKMQKAHRFRVPDGATSGVPAKDHTYVDYVDVPFEVWDITNNRQLMVSFRDQDRNGEFNLTLLDDVALMGREYVWINDVDYAMVPSSLITKNGGHEYEEIAFWWPVLSDGAIWDPISLPESEIIINRIDIFPTQIKSTKIADWAAQGAPYVHADNHQIQFTKTAKGTTRIIVTNDGGLGYSDNLGATWSNPSNGYNTTQFYGVDKHPTENRYIGGLQDNGSWVSSSNPNNLSTWTEATGGDGFDAVWNAAHPNKMMTSIYFNSLYLSNDQGATWGNVSNFKDEGSGNAPFITQIGYTPIDPDKLYIVGKSGVTYSEDFGQTWTLSEIADSLWGWSGDGFVEPSIANPAIVWAASQMSSSGHVMVSSDGGKNFSPTINFDEEMGAVSGLATHPLNDSIAYVLFSYSGYAKILRTTNLGQSWEDLSGFESGKSNNGFPDVAVYSLLVMPDNPNEIWAGTEIGLFISSNNGQSWNYANNGLQAVSIWEMKVRGTQVIMATHGRGIWSVDIPDLANAVKAPALLSVVTTPTNEINMKVIWGASYDSVMVMIDDTTSIQLSNATSFGTEASYRFNLGLSEGEHYLNIIAYKDEYVLKSIKKSFLVINYLLAQEEYSNSFDEPTSDFIGKGFQIMEYSAIGKGMAIHSAHPYADNQDISYYLKVPIVLDNTNTFMQYRDIPCIEEGDAGSVYGSANFYDYGIIEASKNGADWLPLLDGYDFRLIKLKADVLGKTIDSRPSASMFVKHEALLNTLFDVGDTIVLRFRLFSDANANGWGWVIDDLVIQKMATGTQDLKSFNSMYPNPCDDLLNVNLDATFAKNSILTIFDLQGRKLISKQVNNQSKVQINTSGLSPASYILELKSGKTLERKKFMVSR